MRKIIALCCLIGILLLSACAPVADPSGTTTSSSATTATTTENTTVSTDDTAWSDTTWSDDLSWTDVTDATDAVVPDDGDGDETVYNEVIPVGNTANLLNPIEGGADAEADALREEILNTEENYTITGTTYYVSPNGDDYNDGTSPETAWKTCDGVIVNRYLLKAGDAVLFERGGIYRRTSPIVTVSGVTYGAYGEGDKPAIYGSSTNYSWGTSWEPSRRKNVWKITMYTAEAGIIVFDHGEAVGDRKLHGLNELEENGDFYHNTETSTLYLYLDKGYPNVVYKDIEIGTREGVFVVPTGSQNVTIDNITIKYAALFGVDVNQDTKGFTMTNCETGWIGGASTVDGTFMLGNGIQFWCNTEDATVENCWFYQIFDAGITPQCSWDDASVYKNLVFRNNLIEYCTYPFEWFDRDSAALWDNLVFEDNILRFSGFAWCGSRPDTPAVSLFVGWNFNYDTIGSISIRNNIFDTSNNNLVYWYQTNGGTTHENVTISGNSFYQKANPTGNAIWYAGNGQRKATNQAELEAAVATFDPNPKVVKWLS